MKRTPRWPARTALAVLGLLSALANAEPPHLVSLPPAVSNPALAGILAETLASATGADFAAARHDNPLGYLDDLRKDRYAVVFEGPHVLGALARRQRLLPVAAYTGTQSFVVAVNHEDEATFALRDLAGQPVCVGGTPDLFAMELVAAIGNPSREPVLVPVTEPLRRVRRLLGGDCRALTLQTRHFLSLEQRDGGDRLRVIHQSASLPGYGVGLSPDLPPALREDIARALVSDDARGVTRAVGIALTGEEAVLRAGDGDAFTAYASVMDTFFLE